MSVTYTHDLKREYEDIFASATVRPEHLAEVDRTVDRIFAPAAMAQYRAVEKATGVPAHVVGIIHVREASQSFNAHLHNGDSLSGRTFHVPAGRPIIGGPPFGWVESATDALTMPGQRLNLWTDWTIGGTAFVLERFNGFGYRYHGINSPYLWGYTTAYERGMYVKDGPEGWSDTAVNRNPGGMAMIKRVVERGLLKGTKPPKPVKPPRKVESAIEAFRKATLRMQIALKEAGFDPGETRTRLYGKHTEAALSAYNRKHHPR